MISVIGGKLTTAAELGRQCARKLGIKVTEPRGAAAFSYSGATLDDFVMEVAGAAGISEDSAEGISEWYGNKSLEVARFARMSADMKAKLCAHTGHIVAEAAYALTHEYAITLADILLRRVPVALGPCWSEECSRMAAGRIGAALGWSEKQVSAEFERFEIERNTFMIRPGAGSARRSQ